MKNKGFFAITLLPILTLLGYSNFSFASTPSSSGTTSTGKISTGTTSTGTTSIVKNSPKLIKTITIDDKKYKIYKNGTIYYIVKPSGLKSPKTFTSLVGVMNYAKTAFKKKALVTSTGTITNQKVVETPKKIITNTGTTNTGTTNTGTTNTGTKTQIPTNNYDSSTRAS